MAPSRPPPATLDTVDDGFGGTAVAGVPRAALVAATVGFLAAGGLVLGGVFMDRWHSVGLDGRITVAGLRVWTAGDTEFTVAGPGASSSTAAALFPVSCGDGEASSRLASSAWRLDLVWGFVVAAACMCFVSGLACGGMAVARARTAARVGPAVVHIPAVLSLGLLAAAVCLALHTFNGWLYCGVPACSLEEHRRSPPPLRASIVDSSSGNTAAATAPQGSCREGFEPSFVLLCVGAVVAALTHLFVTWSMGRFLSRVDRDRRVAFYSDDATAANVAAHASRSRAAQHHHLTATGLRARRRFSDDGSSDGDSDHPRKQQHQRRPPALPGDEDFDDGGEGAFQIIDEQPDPTGAPHLSPVPRQPPPTAAAAAAAPASAPAAVLGAAGTTTEWLWFEDTGMYYSAASATFWDPASGYYFDPSAQEWIDSETGVRFSA